ncbi:hypothetical protein SPLA5a_PHROGS00227 [Salmonella phage SPLA5a]|nr:hypothetical protein SPLA5a_PHROGS00227 [Salmonella phage SPLA5a]
MRKFFKWLKGLFSSSSVVTVGSGNTTTVTQTSTVRVLKGRDPKGNYEYKIKPLCEQEIRDISRKAVEDVAAQKLVTKALDEIRQERMKVEKRVSRPAPPPTPPARSTVSSRSVSRSSASRRDDDDYVTTSVIASSIYSSSSSSDDGGSYSSGSCDSGSSSGGCD